MSELHTPPDSQTHRYADACWAVSQATTPEATIDILVRSARHLWRADGAFFVRRNGHDLAVTQASGLTEPETASRWQRSVGEGIVGWAVAYGRQTVVNDVAADPRRVHRPESLLDAESVCSLAVVPLHGGPDTSGALCLFHRSYLGPDEWPVDQVALLVRQAADQLRRIEIVDQERLARREAESALLDSQNAAGLPGRVARSLTVDGDLRAALDLLAEHFGGSVILIGDDGTVIAGAGGYERNTRTGPVPFGGEVGIDDGSGIVAHLRLLRRQPLRPDERHALAHCANVIALGLLRERSLLQAERRVGRDLLYELLRGDVSDEGGLRYRAAILGIDLTSARAVLRIGSHVGPSRQKSTTALREMHLRSLESTARDLAKGAFGWISDSDIVLVLDVAGLNEGEVRELSRKLLKTGSITTGKRLSAGVGRICTGVGDYPHASVEAKMALEIARHRPIPDSVGRDELGICGLLGTSADPKELVAVSMRLLSPIIDADRDSGSEYVHTLKIFLRTRQVVSAAAQLHVHVNTLRHRLRKIEDLLDVDLGDANTRFMLELALRVQETLRPNRDERVGEGESPAYSFPSQRSA